MEVLWLTEDDVKSLLTMDEAIVAVENAFIDQCMGRAQMPPKSYLYFSKYYGDLRTMPAYLEGLDSAGVKIVNVHVNNQERGLQTVMALLILNSPETGAPLSIMGATHLTSIRTGAAGAIAAKHLARPESNTVGLVGAGVQARTQLLGLSRLFDIKRVIVSNRSMRSTQHFESDVRTFLECDYELTTNPQEACNCDILVTTTPSRSPIIRESWVEPGTHINAIGADAKGKQELESSLTKKAKVVVDDITQAVHSGEINVPISQAAITPKDIYAQIGEILTNIKPGRTSNEEITIFDSTGLGIQDISTGSIIYKKAQDAGIGIKLSFL